MSIKDYLPGYKQIAGEDHAYMTHNLRGVTHKPSRARGEYALWSNQGVLDHCKLWRGKNGRRVVTSEPYRIDADALRRLCLLRGLFATVYPKGSGDHHPQTYLIVFEKPRGHVLFCGVREEMNRD